MRLHIVSLPHAHVSRDVTVCAFTTKTAKFLKMMGQRGHEITLYGGELSEVGDYAELVPIYSDEEQKSWFGDLHPNELPRVAGSWQEDSPQFKVTNARAMAALYSRYKKGDIVLLTGGLAQRSITNALPHMLTCEWAAGYSGWYCPYVCFESYAWKHYCYGCQGVHDGRAFDAVIPNFFDLEEWELAPQKEDYLLFVGRLIARKGPNIAADIAAELGLPLVVAGSGMASVEEGLIVCEDGTQIKGDVQYVGTVGWEVRSKLMGAARALLAPTQYIEPFGAVVVEAMLSGTPSIATDWGSFTEILPAERRFNTIAEGCDAVERAMNLPPAVLQAEAISRYSFDAIAPLYEHWFERLLTLWEDGYYQKRSASPAPAKILA